MRVEPERYLTRWMGPEYYWLWLRRQAIVRAGQYILGVPRDAFVATIERGVKRYEESLETKTSDPDTLPAALEWAFEDVRSESAPAGDGDGEVEAEQDPRDDRLEELLTSATPDERALLNVWRKNPEAKAPELARKLNKTPAAVRKLQERIRRRGRQI